MKKLLLILFLAPLFIFSKEDTLSVKEKLITVGISFSPDFCYSTLNQSIKDLYVPKAGDSYGFTIKCRLSKNISIKTGFSYHNLGYQTKKMDTVFYLQGQSGIIYKPVNGAISRNYYYPLQYLLNARAVYSYSFYGIPIVIDFKIKTKNKNLFFNVGFGAEINWLTKAQFKLVDNKNVTSDHYTYRTGNNYPLEGIPTPGYGWEYSSGPRIMGLLNAGLNYKLNNHFTVSLEPSFRFVFSGVPDAIYRNKYIYSIGVNTGINYTF